MLLGWENQAFLCDYFLTLSGVHSDRSDCLVHERQPPCICHLLNVSVSSTAPCVCHLLNVSVSSTAPCLID